MNNPLYIRGLGLASAAGPSLTETRARLDDPDSLITRHDAFFDASYDNLSCIFAQSQVLSDFETRTIELIEASWRDCLANGVPSEPVNIIVLLPESDRLSGMPKERVVAVSAQIHGVLIELSKASGIEVVNFAFVNKGSASLAIALRAAALEGVTEHLVIGADSFCDRQRLAAASQNGLLFSNRDKWGAIPGEAGGVLWVSPLPRDTTPLTILAAGEAREEIVERDLANPSDHSGLSRAVQAACDPLGALQCDRWLSDMNNGRYRASELAYAIHRATAFWLSQTCDVTHVPMTFGECGAAYGFLAIMFACQAEPDTGVVISASSVLGARGVIVVRRH